MELTRVVALHLTILLSVASCSRAICCHKTSVFFYTVFDCAHFFAESSGELCFRDNACHNGERATEGTYCGVGSCNIFGCNCEGGCRGGNTSEAAFPEIERSCKGWCVPVVNENPAIEVSILREQGYKKADLTGKELNWQY